MRIFLFILMFILMICGLPLLLSEMVEFELVTYVTAKCIGLIMVYTSYVIYKTQFTKIELR